MKTYSHDSPKQLAPNLWEIRGEWSNKFGRRMTIVRLRDGDVLVHSAIRLQQRELDWLRGLGQLRAIIAPNKFHCSDAPWMAAEFPDAALYAPTMKLAELESARLKPKNVATDFPADIAGELECFPMAGTRIDESAFIHHPSRTLILCDLAMNMEDVFTGIQGAFMRWNKVGGRFGITRLTRLVFTKDRRSLLASYQRLLEQDFDRIIVNHGAVLETGGHALLQQSVSETFGTAGT